MYSALHPHLSGAATVAVVKLGYIELKELFHQFKVYPGSDQFICVFQ